MPLPKLLKSLLDLPTASYVEHAVIDAVRNACAAMPGVTVREDRYGNLLASYKSGPPRTRPICLVSHMDHPGFVALEMLDRSTVRAAFRGSVKPEYFKNAKVRFWSEGRWAPAKVQEISRIKPLKAIGWSGRPEEALLRVSRAVAPQAPGMWDLPDAALKGDVVSARGCDDVAGVAAMIEALARVARKGAAGALSCLFTRAEEVGFIGAIGAIRAGTISRDCAVVSIETSSARPHTPIGAGPILRVGDKAVVFSPTLTAFLGRKAAELAQRRKTFKFQRALMDGGTCEAYAFAAYGYDATGICVPLGNYHNMDVKRGKIASEWISLTDWKAMVDWFEAIATDANGYDPEAALSRAVIDDEFDRSEALLM